jgi:hypothetical protein
MAATDYFLPITSLRRHHYGERHLDEFLNSGRSLPGRRARRQHLLLDPIGKLQNGSFEGELVFVDLE